MRPRGSAYLSASGPKNQRTAVSPSTLHTLLQPAFTIRASNGIQKRWPWVSWYRGNSIGRGEEAVSSPTVGLPSR